MSDVPLKEYVESLISELEKRLDERQKIHDAALDRQAKEYERRLGDLNNEQSRLAKDREDFVRREKFEDWRAIVDAKLASEEGKKTGLSFAWSVVISVLAAAIAAWGVWRSKG